MKSIIAASIAVLFGLGNASYAAANPPRKMAPRVMLKFGTMYGVDGPFLEFKVRGIPGDDLPWEIERVQGVLLTDGSLAILVRGLIIPDEEGVPENVRGINPSPTFRAAVSCLTEVGDNVEERNVISREFPANREGDSFIATRLDLPNPCAAPIVLILSGREDDWFAITGNEIEEEED